ncbi:type IV secretory system conjugative DNA transfer family protein [uncultured Arthrobacter sp.]|uniref:type IV secretory system conjugative DNA transfer family protein n=1 Tax=uncultured Arthrobacter sp. TaxID=114050 RepID=UPI002627E4DD|nr:type IV secretory system conjugative DNA transfer family protein [uncultured Arthrobacter sp.]
MSSLDRKHKAGLGGEAALLVVLIVALVGVPGALYGLNTLGHQLAPRPEGIPTGFWPRSLGNFTGIMPWRSTEITLVIIAGVVLLALFVLYIVMSIRKGRKIVKHDRAAVKMASLKDVAPFTEKQVKAKAARFGIEASDTTPGVMIGRMVRGGNTLYASWEDTLLHIWGTRTGKTTTQAAPSIIEAPGPVIATSNKRDLTDLTRNIRAENGDVWIFDPQSVANETPTWWWNPLSYVTDAERAMEMANNFALGSRSVGAKADAYFDNAGKDLLAGYLLAAAVSGRPISQVHSWLSHAEETEASVLLLEAGWLKEADSIGATMALPDKQREGVYGTARQMATCLKNEKIAPWVNPAGPDDPRPQFIPEDFIKGKHTLYALSKEGAGTAGPLVTSLTVATATAAEEYAATQPGGRLAVPMLCVLDEAANVCRWGNLPNLYSHYGSRGIVISTFLQSWSQGVDVWDESGMKKLFSTANVFTYGGNVKEEGFLKMLSELVGQYRYTSVSTSRQKDSRSTSRQDSTDDILSVADLAAMPKGRAIMLGSGSRAVLLRTVPISDRPYAAKIAAFEAARSNPPAPTPAPALVPEPVVEQVEESVAQPVTTAGGGNRWSSMVKD